MYSYSKNKNSNTKKNILIIVAVILVTILILAVLEFKGVTHIIKKKSVYIPPQTIGQQNKGEVTQLTSNPDSNSGNNSSTSSQSLSKHETINTPVTNLFSPYGAFVSNHGPSLSDKSRNTENSVCVTSPGAICTISFTKGSLTKSLPGQTTDNEGATYWNSWKISDYLSVGTWTVQAKATYKNLSKTASDPLQLTVSP